MEDSTGLHPFVTCEVLDGFPANLLKETYFYHRIEFNLDTIRLPTGSEKRGWGLPAHSLQPPTLIVFELSVTNQEKKRSLGLRE